MGKGGVVSCDALGEEGVEHIGGCGRRKCRCHIVNKTSTFFFLVRTSAFLVHESNEERPTLVGLIGSCHPLSLPATFFFFREILFLCNLIGCLRLLCCVVLWVTLRCVVLVFCKLSPYTCILSSSLDLSCTSPFLPPFFFSFIFNKKCKLIEKITFVFFLVTGTGWLILNLSLVH